MKLLTKIILIGLCLIPVIWFVGKPGILIDGSDTNFPLDPAGWFSRRLYVWNTVSNAGADFSASTAGTVFHLIQVLPTLLGFSLQVTEIISLVFWFSAILLSAFFLFKTVFPDKPWLSLLSASIYAINPYMFNTWENAKVSNIALVLALPLFVNLVIRLNQKKTSLGKGLLLSVLFGLLISGFGINPAYFLVFAIVFWLSALVFYKSLWKSVLVFGIVLAVNSFWILPTARFVFGNIGPFGGLEKIGYTNWIDSLSQNTSLFNVLRLQGAWDWYAFDSSGTPTYIPYAVNYFYRAPFIVFSLIIPTIAFLAFVLHDKKHRSLILFLGLILLLGAFMSAGTHPPTGVIFKWLLVKRLPFFSLFRSPWYIFTPLIILAYSGLTAIFLEKLSLKKAKIALLVSGIVFVGNLVYCYPLITGKIFRPAMADNFYIRFPSYVFEAQKWLKSAQQPLPGRILSYPPDEIERFGWGYNGIDSILSLLSSVDVLFSPLNAPEFTTASILKEVYHYLGNGDVEAAENLAGRMNIAAIFEKNDQNSLFFKLPEVVKKKKLAEFGPWSFYSFPIEAKIKPRIYSSSVTVSAFPYVFAGKMLPLLSGEEILVNPNDSIIKGDGQIILAQNSQVNELAKYERIADTTDSRIVDRKLDEVKFIFKIKDQGSYQPILERSKLDKFDIDFNLEVEKYTQSYVYFKPQDFEPGEHILTMRIRQKNLVDGGSFESGEKFKRMNDSVYKFIYENGNTFLEITNKDKSAPEPAASFMVNEFDPALTYLIKIKYKRIFGNIPQLDAIQSKGDVTYQNIVERFPIIPEWQNYGFFFKPVFTDSILKVNLVAPFISTSFGTRIQYDDLEVYPLFDNNLFLVKSDINFSASPQVEFKKISPVLYEGSVKGVKGNHMVVFSENYSPAWVWQSAQVKNARHFTANLYANAWYIEGAPQNYKFKLYYWPQSLRYLGLLILIVTISSALFFWIYEKRLRKS